MGGSDTDLHIAVREWCRKLRRHPRIAVAALFVWLAEESLSHRFFEWFNRTIDDYGLRTMEGTLNLLMWISSNPLGITGIIVIFVLLLTFVHSYMLTSFGNRAGDRFARSVVVLVVIIIGVALMRPLTSGQEVVTRVALVFVICGIVGAALNEAFVHFASAQQRTDRLNPSGPATALPGGPGMQRQGGDVNLQGNVSAGNGSQAPGGDANINAGTGYNGASGGNVSIGPGNYSAGNGGPGGTGGNLNIKAGDAK